MGAKVCVKNTYWVGIITTELIRGFDIIINARVGERVSN